MLVLVMVVTLARAAMAESCNEAHLRCAYRTGCGRALQNYVLWCSGELHARRCPDPCVHALVALTSTHEGSALTTCECHDDMCEETKRRVEVCRPAVEAATRNASVNCRMAQWICAADALCSTALDYYHHHCRAMFAGKKCTHRCNNSISILRRQEKAATLISCTCDGQEDYDCPRIRDNMQRLCFPREHPSTPPPDRPCDTTATPASDARQWRPGAAALLLTVVLLLRFPT